MANLSQESRHSGREDMAKGIFVKVSQLPMKEPKIAL